MNGDDGRSSPLGERVADALGTAVESVAELDGDEVGRVARATPADCRTAAAKTGETPLDAEAFVLDVLADRGHSPNLFRSVRVSPSLTLIE
jgi:hypothetical protein